AGLVDDRAGGAVLAGNPLGVNERHRAGLHRHRLPGVEDLARSIGEVDGESDGGLRTRETWGDECGAGKRGAEEARKMHLWESSWSENQVRPVYARRKPASGLPSACAIRPSRRR